MRKQISLSLLLIAMAAGSAYAQATFTSFSPASGPIGTPVTITGTGFNTTAASNIVYFGATKATVTAATATQLNVNVPAGATYQPISVIVGGVEVYSSKPFVVTFPGPGGISATSFAAKVDFPAGTTPVQTALADVDGDGKSDIIQMNGGVGGAPTVLRNTSVLSIINSSSFAAGVAFTSGTSPYSVAVDDLDGDGKLDFAVANFTSNTVSVFRNTSVLGTITASSFAAKVDVITGTNPESVAIGDLDGDGKPDLVVANSGSTSISVFRNTSTSGSISFTAKVDFTAGTTPVSVAVADLDGDGKRDIAVANYGSASLTGVSVLRNATTATGNFTISSFSPKVDFATGTNPNYVAIGDIDGDGKSDMVIPNYNSTSVSVFRNTSTSGTIAGSSFAPKVDFIAGANPNSVVIGDLDGDGKVDMAVTYNGVAAVSAFRNTSTSGAISFVAKVDFTTGATPISVAIGDLDGDGKSDLAVANNTGSTVSVLLNTSISSQPTVTSFSPASGPVGTPVTIVGTNFSLVPANNFVYFGAVRATVTAATATQLTVTAPAGATYQPISVRTNGLVAYTAAPFVLTFPSLGGITTSSFAPKVDFTASTGPLLLALADIDGDGKSEISVANGSAGPLSVFRNTSLIGTITTGALAPAVSLITGTNPYGVAADDLDGDGKLDLVVTNYQGLSVSVFRNISTSGAISLSSFAARADFTTGTNPAAVAITDVDGDGRPDLIVTNNGSATVSVFRNTSTPGTIALNAKLDFTVGTNPVGLAIGDVDIDGKRDVAVANYGSATMSVLRNLSTPGTITFNPKVDFITGTNPNSVAFGDMDGDGKSDLAVANAGGTTVSVFRNTSASGSITLLGKIDFTTGTNPNFVAVGDLDGDGKLEMAVTYNTVTSVSVFRNTGTSGTIAASTFAPKVDFTTGAVPSCVAIGDIDGDGKSEMTVSNNTPGTISIFQNKTPALPPTITSFTPLSGQTGSTVTITGTNFNTTAANNTVYFGAVRATVTGGTGSTSLTVTVPVGATLQPITVTNSGLTAYSTKTFLVTFPSLGGISTSSFSAKVDFAAGTNPYDVAIGDIDRDGKPDLSVTNNGSATISVYRNTSTSGVINASSFAGKVDFVSGNDPVEVVASDIDGDGNLDLATANLNDNTVSVFRNTSTSGSITASSLTAKVDFTTNGSPSGTGAVDLDGDGKTDLVVCDNGSTAISILRNTGGIGSIGASSFAAKTDLTVGTFPFSVAIGDLDGDGLPDVVIPNAGSETLSIFRNTSTAGSITFAAKVDLSVGTSSTSTKYNPLRVILNDLDGDGKLDIATTINNYATLSVFRNVGSSGSITTSSFATKIDYATGTNPYCVAAGDLDGDGKLDLIVTNDASATISIYRNNSTSGSISFASKVDYATGSNPEGVRVGDLDGDSRPELVVENYGSGTISIFRNAIPNITLSSFSFPATIVRGSTVKASITLGAAATGTVKFWSKGISDTDANYQSQVVTASGLLYEVTLGNSNFTDAIGLTYYFEVGTGAFTPNGWTYIEYPTVTTDPQLIPSLNFGNQLSNYQIISIPLVLKDKTVTSAFKSLGAYDRKKWRLYSYVNNATVEYPNFSTLDIGTGYWLIVKDNTTINPGDGITAQVTASSPYVLALKPGWNLIGNPYNFRVSWADILAANGNPTTVGKLRVFSGASLSDGTVLDKYRGAYVNATAAISLKVPVLKNTTLGGREAEVAKNTNAIDQNNWEVRLSLSDGELSNHLGAIGMNPDASVGKDRFDEENLPLPDGFGLFEVQFKHQGITTTFDKDFVPPTNSHTWDFTVNKGFDNSPITLSWPNDYYGENGKQIYLFDVAAVKAVDMRAINEYKLSPESQNMKIIYGDQAYIDAFLDHALPFVGTVYPNPSSGSLSVPFRIPTNTTSPMNVTISVFDSQGRVIATIINGSYQSGSYEAKWESTVGPGLYCIQSRIGLENQTQKVIIK